MKNSTSAQKDCALVFYLCKNFRNICCRMKLPGVFRSIYFCLPGKGGENFRNPVKGFSFRAV